MDFLNKQNLTYISIFIFIILSIFLTYNTNANIKNNTKTITENFLILTEDQELKDNKVNIDNLSQVTFSAGSIAIANPMLEWPLSLQEIFDTKIDKLGVIGLDKNLQGIVIHSTDDMPKPLVNIGSNIPLAMPTTATTLNDNWIQFGGKNSDKQDDSARISVNASGSPDSLCIVGMSSGTAIGTRKIQMIAEGGCGITGPLNVTSTCNFGGNLTVTNGGLIVTGTTGTGNFGGALTVDGITTINNNLIVTGTGKIDGTLNVGGITTINNNLIVTGTGKIDGTLNVGGNTTMANNLNVTGTGSFGRSLTITGTGANNITMISFLVRGCIIMFHGTGAPEGWAICNGDNGTPDLRGRFILGISGSHPLNQIGGAESVTLTIAQMPSHNHNLNYNNACFKNGGCDSRHSLDNTTGYKWGSDSTGGNQPHENMPPFYALLYIMKL